MLPNTGPMAVPLGQMALPDTDTSTLAVVRDHWHQLMVFRKIELMSVSPKGKPHNAVSLPNYIFDRTSGW